MANFAQLGIEITSSGVDKAQSGLDALANSGGKAEASLKGVEQAATSTDSTVKKLSDSALYRANQSIAKYSQGLRDASQESERAAAAARNESDVIAALARERAKAADFARANADATRQSTKATVDWAAEQQRANARAAEMVAQDAKRAASAQKANTAIQDQQRDLAKLLGQIDPTVAALGRLDEAERKLAGFRKQGAIDSDTFNQYSRHLNEQRELLGKVDSAQRLAGLSAGQYSNAIRMLPAQFTDIFTSLAGGQNPFLVMIQQGGQVSDSFGGIGNTLELMKDKFLSLFSISSSASSALDGISDSSSESSDSLSGLSEGLNSTSDAAGNARDAMEKVPIASSAMFIGLTAAAAVVVALGVALYQAGQRTERINEALISTGRFAKTSADDIKALADSIDGLSNVSGGKAISAVTALATTTQLTGDALTSAAAASVQWAAVTGQTVDSVVDKFRAIQKDPLNALTDLNAAEQFLTETQYQRINALQDEGQWQDAATEAAKIYADVVAGRAQEIQSNLGGISVAWQNIKTASSDAWGAVISGADRASEAIGATARRIAGMNSLFKQVVTGYAAASPTGLGAFFGVGAPRSQQVIMPGVDGETRTPEPIRDELAKARADAEKAKADAANAAWNQTLATTNKVIAQELALDEIEKKGLAAGASRVEIEKQKAAYIDQQEKKARRSNTDNNSAVTLLETAQRQVTANEQLSTSGEKVTASGRLVIQINQRLADTTDKMTAATRAQLVAVRDSLTTSDAEARAAQQKTRDLAANIALTERLASAQKVQADQNEVALMGIGRGSQAAELAQRELNIRRDYLKQVNDLEKAQRNENTALTANELQVEKDMLSAHLQAQLAAEQSYQDQRMAMQADWRNGFTASFEDYSAQAANVAGQTKSLFDSAFKGAEDAMVKFAMTGKLSFTDLANSIIEDLIRIAAKQAVLQIAGAITGAFTGGGGGGSGVGSTQLGNNYNWGGGFSGGGYTGQGGKYQPAGIVHRGEVVWSQRDVAAVGGPRAANAMRPTAGYANGGGPGIPQSRGIGQMSAPQITFNMNMQDGTITSQQQGGNADDSTRELKQMFEAMINAWWTKNNRPGGAAYNMRMGTA